MIGVWVNMFAVIIGGSIGTFLRSGISAKYRSIINSALGLCSLAIGITGAIKTHDMMGIIIALVLGGVLGELIRIEYGLDKLGNWAQKKLAKNDAGFSQGFVSATLLFCIGAMAVVGSLEAGLSNKPDTLLAKSMMDGVSSIIFASSMGPGVILSALPLTLYQGGIAMLSGLLAPVLSEGIINEISAAGGLLIIGIGINLLGMTKERIKVGNLLPAMVVVVLYQAITGLF